MNAADETKKASDLPSATATETTSATLPASPHSQPGTPQGLAPNVNISPPVNPVDELKKILGEVGKYTVLTVFTLYCIGFLIWHSYLATYSVSSIDFLQTEYLSAAICYLLLVACIVTPPAILIERWITGDKTHKVSHLIYLWYLVIVQAVGKFFPSSSNSSLIFKYSVYGIGFIVLYMIGLRVCRRKWGQTRIYKRLWNFDAYSTWLVGYVFVSLFSNPEASKLFIVFSFFVYLLSFREHGQDLRKVWSNSGFKLRFLLLCLMGLILISHVQMFGSFQFGKIPKSMGGGKPDSAYVKFSPQHPEIAQSLRIPIATNTALADGFVGPVAILLRTDKELIFLNNTELTWPDFITNDVVKIVATNVIVSIVTNYASVVTTNSAGKTTTNLVPTVVTTVASNLVTTTKTASMNVTKMTAKQVRSDLVDAIIFSK